MARAYRKLQLISADFRDAHPSGETDPETTDQ